MDFSASTAVVDGRDVGVDVGALADQHDQVLLPGVAQVRHDHLQVGEVHGDVFEPERQAPTEPRAAGEGRPLVPHDRQAELLALPEERPVLAVLRVEVLVDRPELEPLEPQIVDAMLQLLDAVGLVGVDRRPALQLLGVLAHVVGDRLVGHPDAHRLRLQPEDDDPVRRLRRRPVLLGPGVVGVQVEPGTIRLATRIF